MLRAMRDPRPHRPQYISRVPHHPPSHLYYKERLQVSQLCSLRSIMTSLNTPPIHGQSSSSRLPVHPMYAEAQQRVAQERQRDEATTSSGGSPGNLSGNSPMNYPRNLATYCPDSDNPTWIRRVLGIILSRSTSLSFDVLDLHNGALVLRSNPIIADTVTINDSRCGISFRNKE